jgi:nicotinamidase-related amidase
MDYRVTKATATALLVMDFQRGVVRQLGGTEALEWAVRAVAAAHEAGVTVIYVRVAFRAGYPDVSSANRSIAAIAASNADFTDTNPETQLHEAFKLEPGDLTVLKRRVSAFTGSDLEVVLRARGITSLVLAGIATGGVVLSTLREAADRDYPVVVLSDACSDMDPEVHRVLMNKVFPRQADVLSVKGWAAAARRADPNGIPQ